MRRLLCLFGFHKFDIIHKKEDSYAGVCVCFHCGKMKAWRGRYRGKLHFMSNWEYRELE